MHAPGEVYTLLWLVAGSFLAPLLAARLRLPAAVLLVAWGVILDATGIIGSEGKVNDFLYQIGFAVLMFLAGLEIDFNALRERGRRAVLEMFLVGLAVLGLAFILAGAFSLGPLVGLALGTTSVGLPLAVLKETGWLKSSMGQQVILLASVGEFLTVLGMTVFYFVARFGFSWQLAVGLLKLAVVIGLALAALRGLMTLAWWRPEYFSMLAKEREHSEMGVRASLVVMMVFSALSMAAGVEIIVGAFLAGALLAFVMRGKQVLEEKLGVIGYGLFIPIFFIIVGIRFEPGLVKQEHLIKTAFMLTMLALVRLPQAIWLWWRGLHFKDALASTFLLSAPLTLIVAVASMGVQAGVATPAEQQTLVVLALASGMIYPALFRTLAPPKSPPDNTAGPR